MAHDVFISHAHKDKQLADAICEKLESASVKCWIAARDISVGEDWTVATRNAIGSSRLMVLVFSENANAAPHIEREIAHAFYTGRLIVPVRLTKTLPRRDFLFYLGNVRWFDALTPPEEGHLEALTASINELVRDRTNLDTATPPQHKMETRASPGFSDSWLGALQASHYRTLEILKRVAIALIVGLAVWLLWFTLEPSKHERPAEDDQQAMASGPGPPLISSPEPAGDAAASKPASTFTRFGLWANPNLAPAASVPTGAQDAPSAPTEATPNNPTSAGTDAPQERVGETEESAADDDLSAKPAAGDTGRKIKRHATHRGKAQSKSHRVKVRKSEESPGPHIMSRLRTFRHQIAARIKEIWNP